MKELLTVMEFDSFDDAINIKSQDISTVSPEEKEKILMTPEAESEKLFPMKEKFDQWSHRPLEIKYFPDGTKKAQILITYTDPDTQEKLWMRPGNAAVVAYRPPKNDMQNPACWKSRQLATAKKEEGYTFAPPIPVEEVQQNSIPIEQPQQMQQNWIDPQAMPMMMPQPIVMTPPTQQYLIPAVIEEDEPAQSIGSSPVSINMPSDVASKWRTAILAALQRDGYDISDCVDDSENSESKEQSTTTVHRIKHPNLIHCGIATNEEDVTTKEPIIEVDPEEYRGFNTDTLIIKADELPSTVPTIETNWKSQFDIGKPTVIKYHEHDISKQIITEEEQLRDWHYFTKDQGVDLSYEQTTPNVSIHPNAKNPNSAQPIKRETMDSYYSSDTTYTTFVPFMSFADPVNMHYKSSRTRHEEDFEKKKILYDKRRDMLLAALKEVGLYGYIVGRRSVALCGMNGKNIQCWNTMSHTLKETTDEEIAIWARNCAAEAKEKCIANGTLEQNRMVGIQLEAKEQAEGITKNLVTLPPPAQILTKEDFEDPNDASVLSSSQIISKDEFTQTRTIYSREDHQIEERDMYNRFSPNALPEYRERFRSWASNLSSDWAEDQAAIAWDEREIELGVGYPVIIKKGDKIIHGAKYANKKSVEETPKKKISTPEHPIFRIMRGDTVIYSSEGDKDELNRQIQEQKEKEQAPIRKRQQQLGALYTLADQIIQFLGKTKREIPWFTKESGWQKAVDDLALELQVYDKATAMVLIESLHDPNTKPCYFADRIYPTCKLILEDYQKRAEESRDISYKASFQYRQVPRKVKFHEKDGSIIEAWVPKSNPERELKKRFEKGKIGKRFPFDLGREPNVEEWAAFYQRAEAELEIEITAIKAKDILLEAEVDKILNEEYAFWESLKRDRQYKLRIWKKNKHQKSVYRSANYASMTNEEFDKWWYQEDPTSDPNYQESKEEADARYIKERQAERDRAIARREAVIETAICYDDPRYIAAHRQWFAKYCEDMANWDEGLMAKCTTISDIFNVAEYLHNREELRRVENKIAQFNFERNINDPSGVTALYYSMTNRTFLDHNQERVSQEVLDAIEKDMKDENSQWHKDVEIFEELLRRENFENDTDLSATLSPAYLDPIANSTSNALSPEEAEALLMRELLKEQEGTKK